MRKIKRKKLVKILLAMAVIWLLIYLVALWINVGVEDYENFRRSLFVGD